MSTPADLGWGDPRNLTSANTVAAQIWPGHIVRVRNDDCAVVFAALIRRLRGAGWPGPDATPDEWGYNKRLKRWAEAAGQDPATAPLSSWSDHAWGTAVDLDTTANPMLPTRPANPQSRTTFPVTRVPAIAGGLGLQWGGSWSEPWDPQHFQVAVTPQALALIAAPIRRSMEVLDYSTGWPKNIGGYGGVIRYIGTPGRGKNMTKAEADWHKVHGVPIALVYEDSAGWMLAGRAAGEQAARSSLSDAANIGVPVRCVFFASDVDIVTPAQFAALDACLDGAASVLGRGRVGVYGEADVIDHCMGNGKAAYGWQTRAWSGGRTSAKACMLQQIGYVTVDGVTCDRNTLMKDDWGQTPYLGDDDMPLTVADAQLVAKALVPYLQELSTGAGNATDNNPLLQQFRDTMDTRLVALANDVSELAADVDGVARQTVDLAAKVDNLTISGVDVPALAALLAPMLTGSTEHLSEGDLSAIAKAVADETARRQTS